MKKSAFAGVAATLLVLAGCTADSPYSHADESKVLLAPDGMPALTQAATGFWTTTASMMAPRQLFPATALGSGTVLVSGGLGLGAGDPTAELYDAATGTWSPVGDMVQSRYNHTASLLASGKVLVTGGGQPGVVFRGAELYDPVTSTWSPTGSMAQWRHSHTATVLASGKVLVAGGYNGTNYVKDAELFNPASNAWSPAGAMSQSRYQHTATRLGSGKVLVTGGFDGVSPLQSAELYDPATNTWSPAGTMAQPRHQHTATLLGSGQVLVTGGFDGVNHFQSAELYDPVSNTWLPAADMSYPRSTHTANLLASGAVLVAGGRNSTLYLAWAELYDPITNEWVPAGSTAEIRARHAAALFGPTTVLVAGGFGGAILQGAELFHLKTDGESCIAAVQCESGFCADGVCCDSPCAGPCDICAQVLGATADGTCTPLPLGSPGSPSCNPYVCSGAGGICPGSCTSDTACILPAYCAFDGTCQPDQTNGTPCSSPSQCQSSYCVEGVCCDNACNQTCHACTAPHTGLADGTCGLAMDGAPETHGHCLDQGAASCKHDGFCDGYGQCRNYPVGAVCFPPTCAGDSVVDYTCGTSGVCQHSQSDCGLYRCENGACNTSCASDADCTPIGWCDAGNCTAKASNGTACTSSITCASDFCVDGVCCDAPCDGQCEACNVPQAEGACVPIAGVPHGSRPACVPASGSDPCAARACDGIERTECLGYAGADVACSPGCFNGTETGPGICNGQGHCTNSKPCGNYACGSTTCKSSCTDNTDCAENRGCVEGQCVAGAACVDQRFFVATDGTVSDCSPFTCETTGCKTACGSVDDCLPPLACDTGKCVPRPQGGLPEGCGCRMAEEPPGNTAMVWFVLATAGTGWRLGRRRLPKPRRPADED